MKRKKEKSLIWDPEFIEGPHSPCYMMYFFENDLKEFFTLSPPSFGDPFHNKHFSDLV